MLRTEEIKRCAAEIGFSACGVAPAGALPEARAEEWRRWLAEGCQAGMDYLERDLEKRLDPRLLVEGAKTVVSLAVNYYSGEVDRALAARPDDLRLARYAYGTDYHDVVKAMLRRLMASLGLEEGRDGRVFVDTAPIDEKYWAQRCGLGWRGRHTQIILPGQGSFFVLGELVLTETCDEYGDFCENRCGTCRKCVEACPTGALRGDGTLDARRCLSYLTIEHRGELPAEASGRLGHCFYGCDRCAEACPHNRSFSRDTLVEAFRPRPEILRLSAEDWYGLTREQYQALFRKSAVKRAKMEGLERNLQAVKQGLEANNQGLEANENDRP